MKKVLLILIICLFCFGCGKNITINIYENKESDTLDDSTILDENFSSNPSLRNDNSDNTINSVGNDDEVENNNINDSTIKEESAAKENSSWYKDHKQELDSISIEIIKEDIDTVQTLFDTTKSWYNDSKDELTASANEIYYNDKETINEIYNKFKK